MESSVLDGASTGRRQRRYFVTVHAADPRALRHLADFELDLFQATARLATSRLATERLTTEHLTTEHLTRENLTADRPDAERFAGEPTEGGSVEGLVSLEDVARLVEAGYQVTVQAEEASRSRASETIGLREWLSANGEV
ncbi:hypothetical protein Lfu02_62240 [Longispora fulva]|uniref:Uncharacterized protein n=1 Tax=Longispora fulva TaxID=619741 RepID=A0A8J7KG71_9ACTN|nr:hypothetical protein [Longispora fulva]MBG6134644.1 hypothetical protein [Longispora fulva]GIG61852.1 hypothetical protein Lfu02_62240 [Longispora fulva]